MDLEQRIVNYTPPSSRPLSLDYLNLHVYLSRLNPEYVSLVAMVLKYTRILTLEVILNSLTQQLDDLRLQTFDFQVLVDDQEEHSIYLHHHLHSFIKWMPHFKGYISPRDVCAVDTVVVFRDLEVSGLETTWLLTSFLDRQIKKLDIHALFGYTGHLGYLMRFILSRDIKLTRYGIRYVTILDMSIDDLPDNFEDRTGFVPGKLAPVLTEYRIPGEYDSFSIIYSRGFLFTADYSLELEANHFHGKILTHEPYFSQNDL